MITIENFVTIYNEKLRETGSHDAAFLKCIWVAYEKGIADMGGKTTKDEKSNVVNIKPTDWRKTMLFDGNTAASITKAGQECLAETIARFPLEGMAVSPEGKLPSFRNITLQDCIDNFPRIKPHDFRVVHPNLFRNIPHIPQPVNERSRPVGTPLHKRVSEYFKKIRTLRIK